MLKTLNLASSRGIDREIFWILGTLPSIYLADTAVAGEADLLTFSTMKPQWRELLKPL